MFDGADRGDHHGFSVVTTGADSAAELPSASASYGDLQQPVAESFSDALPLVAVQ